MSAFRRYSRVYAPVPKLELHAGGAPAAPGQEFEIGCVAGDDGGEQRLPLYSLTC